MCADNYRYIERLRAERLNYADNGIEILHDVRLNVFSGEILGLCGANDSGKSTLIQCICGLQADFTGRVWNNELLYHPRTRLEAQASGIYLIGESSSLIDSFTVLENLEMLPKRVRRERRIRKYRKLCMEVLEKYCPDIAPGVPTGALTRAEQIIVELVRAGLGGAQVIFMDGVLCGIANTFLRDMLVIMHHMTRDGMSIVIAENAPRVLCMMSDRLNIMRSGRSVAMLRREEINEDTVTALMLGSVHFDAENTPTDKRVPAAETALSVENLRCGRMFSGLSFDVRRGECLGILNFNKNSGRIIEDILLGRINTFSGRIRVFGQEASAIGRTSLQSRGLYLLPEENAIFEGLSLHKNIEIAAMGRTAKGRTLIDASELKYTVGEILEAFFGDLDGETLPHGRLMEKKLGLCRAVAAGARILVLRNCTLGLDVASRRQLLQDIQRLKQAGMTLLFIDMDVKLLSTQCDRILVVSRGACIGQYTNDAASIEALHRDYREYLTE